MKRRSDRWFFPWLLMIAGTLFGLMLEPVLSSLLMPLFTNETRILLTMMTIMSGLMTLLIMTIIFFAKRSETREQQWLQIEERLGLPAHIVFEPIEHNPGTFHTIIANYLQSASAGDEIVVMTRPTFRSGHANPRETSAYRQALALYVQTLLDKAKEPGIIYRRIICFDEGPQRGKLRHVRVHPWIVEHAQAMLELRKQKPDAITLKKSAVLYGSDILVIREKFAAISLDIWDSDGYTHTDGAILFHHPPNLDVIHNLYAICMRTDAQSIPIDQVPE